MPKAISPYSEIPIRFLTKQEQTMYEIIRKYFRLWPQMEQAFLSIPKEERCKGYMQMFYFVMRQVLLTWEDVYSEDVVFDIQKINSYFEDDKEGDSQDIG